MKDKLSCGLWDYDDITPCFKDRYLNFYLPVVVFGISFVILSFKSGQSWVKSYKNIHLKGDDTRPLLADSASHKYTDNASFHSSGINGTTTNDTNINDNNDNDDRLFNTAEIKARHFNLTKLQNTNEHGKPYGHVVEVNKDTFERFKVSLEYLLLIVQLVLSILVFTLPGFKNEFNLLQKLIKVLYWGYLFVIGSFRIVNINRTVVKLPSLFAHSFVLYFFNFFPSVLLFRSSFVGHHATLIKAYYIVNFVCSVSLFLLALTAKVGDKPSRLYVTNDNSDPSPETTTSILSFITYSWLDKLIWKGYTTSLKVDDIWSLREDDYALHVLKGFEAAKLATRFTVRVFAHFKFLFMLQASYSFLEAFIIFLPTLLLKKILEYVADPTIFPKNVAWTLVILMPFCKIVDSLASGCSLFLGRRVCVRMRAVIIGQVYAKALRRKITVSAVEEDDDKDKSKDSAKGDDKDEEKTEGKKTAELGAIINLMAIDAFKVSEVCGYLHFFTGAIIMIFVCLYLLYNLIGWSAWTGALVIFCFLPINYKIAVWLGNLQKRMLAITDKRIQKLNETLNSIRIIKFFAWEDKFFEQIMKIRKDEIHELMLRSISWAAGSIIWFLTPTLICLVSFYCYTVIEGEVLTAPIAFTALSLFTLLRSPLDQLSDMTAMVMQSKVSLDRVGEFLAEDETSKYEQLTMTPGPNSPKIGFENASFTWNKNESNSFKLRDLNVEFKKGQLNVIFGPTGSGKTSLLMALLGEMDLLSGKVFLPGIIPRDELVVDPQTGLTESVAYCSQAAWLLNDTIRNNVTFGSPFNQDRYDKVIDACGLTRDLEILSAGDSTEIGEKGITLSGGQKQRVSLARALYSNSLVVILDDCLSAVDSHTALWIYENCISGPLMANRTCILVSHNVPLTVQNADWVVMIDNGRVKSQDTPQVLLESGALGADDLVKNSVLNSKNQSSTDLTNLKDSKETKNADLKAKSAIIDAKLKDFEERDATANPQSEEIDDVKKHDGKLIEAEGKAEGVVSSKVYLSYLKFFGGSFTWISIISVYIVSQMVYISQTWWLRKWSMNSSSQAINSAITSLGLDGTVNTVYNGFQQNYVVRTFSTASDIATTFKEEKSTYYYLTVYGIIGVVYAFFASGKMLYTFILGIDASNRMFVKVLTTVLNAKLRFFDKTPIGRIMNRFSKDMEAVDQDLTPYAEFTFICVVQCCSTLFIITVITPGFLIFAFFIAFVYYVIGILYISLSRELKRFESISKSPIHQHFSESLSGIATIRAYGVESRFMKQNLLKIDKNNKPFFYMWVANRWLSFRVEAAGALVMFLTGIFVLLSVGKIDAGLAGLSLTYAIAFSESALWIVRCYSDIEMNMNSVERLQEYFEIEQEPPHEIPETEPRASWPEHGEIDVQDVSLRYAPELPRVIKNITFHVEPNTKIGIVGRTGAGKSTIITAFFRFLDPETGKILIDGVDICKIGLKNLRQAITIIPQDPTLFTGTIKSNLDPFEEFTDSQMFEALRRVNLVSTEELQSVGSSAESIGENQNQFLNLESAVTEGGGNLSQGQRQLMCLARSLLRSPKVMLLDEATASIDYESDAMIQQTIREEFSNSTILTIAHRLRSIVDYDKILVMDAGKVVEYDEPYTLIANTDSLFYSMCENSGELDALTKLAKESFIAKKNSKK